MILCPLTSRVILAVESLAISIRQNVDIKGIKVGNHEAKLLQYADDTTAIPSDENFAKMLFQELEVFKNFSALEINSSKTEGMWSGSLKRKDEKPFGIKWPREPIKALGTFRRFFSGYSGFPLSAKTNISKFQFDPERSSV